MLSRLRFVYTYGLLGLVLFLPVFFVPGQPFSLLQSKMLLIALAACIVALAFVVDAIRKGRVSLPFDYILLAALLLPLAYGLSAMSAGGSMGSLVGSGTEAETLAAMAIWFSLLLFGALIFSQGEDLSVRLLRCFFVSGAVVLLFEWLRLFFPNALSLGGTFVGETATIVGNWHDLGILLGLLVILGAALARSDIASGSWRYLFIAVSVLALLFLILQNMRDIWLAIFGVSFIAILVPLITAYRKRIDLRKILKERVLFAALSLLALILAFAGTALQASLPEPLKVDYLEVRPSWQGTLAIGKEVLEEPGQMLFGSGPNTFLNDWNLHKPANINETPYWNVDFGTGIGTVPTSFVTLGVVGIAAWGIFLLFLLWHFARFFYLRFASASDVSGSVALVALFLTVFLIVYAPTSIIVALTFVVFGWFIAIETKGKRSLSLQPTGFWGIFNLIATLLFALLIVASCAGVLRVLISDLLINRSVLLYNRSSDAVISRELIQSALKVAPRNDRAHRAAVELGLIELRKLIAAGSSDAKAAAKLQSALGETIGHALSAVEINGSNYQNWLTLAGIYADLANEKIPGAYEHAKAAYERAFESNPTNPLPLVRLAQLELSSGNSSSAESYLSQALSMKPDLAAALYLKSQISAERGDLKKAMAEATDVVRLVQNDPVALYNLGVIAYGAKDYHLARASLEQAVALEASYSNALYILGFTYYHLDDNAKAEETFKKVLELNPDNKVVKGILSDLRVGGPIRNTPR